MSRVWTCSENPGSAPKSSTIQLRKWIYCIRSFTAWTRKVMEHGCLWKVSPNNIRLCWSRNWVLFANIRRYLWSIRFHHLECSTADYFRAFILSLFFFLAVSYLQIFLWSWNRYCPSSFGELFCWNLPSKR